MTKAQLEKLLGITLEEGKETYTDDEALELISKDFSSIKSDRDKTKNLLSQRNSEIAEFKRKEQDKLSEEEKTRLHYEELEKNYASLQKTVAKSTRASEYMGIGYPKELAEKIADAELEGKPTAEFHKQFITSREESIRAELLKNPPKVTTTDKGDTVTREDYKKMTYSQRMELKDKNPELFEQVSKDTPNN